MIILVMAVDTCDTVHLVISNYCYALRARIE